VEVFFLAGITLEGVSLTALAAISLLWAAGAVLLIPLGLPGNWLIAAVGLLGPTLGLGWWPLAALVGLAGVAELLELGAALRTTRRSGAGRVGAWGAVLGGLAGGVLATPLLPLIGSLVGACLGAALGAVLLESLARPHSATSLGRIGWGAFLGALLGRLGKALIGVIQIVVWAWWLVGGAGIL
jgi:uncharacterized protein YqgC (DUF456 family)